MDRRCFLAVSLSAALAPLLLTACGDDQSTVAPSGTAGSDPTAAPVEPTGIEHPTGADDVVIRLGFPGGFVPAGFGFLNMPTVLITGDGRLVEPGAMTAIYPGPLLKPLFVRPISEEGIQNLLELADANSLLQEPPVYARNDMIADAPNTEVLLGAAGGSFLHSAYALGMGQDETDPDRGRLQAFVNALQDLPASVGEENMGEQVPLVATRYRMMAMVVDPAGWAGSEPAPTTTDWPADAPVRLADATVCAEIDAADADPLFQDATELSFFVEDDVTYQLFVAPLLPGDAAC